jgi:serine/threonine protein kinase
MGNELVGQSFGNFQIEALVASRARGAVYAARHTELDRKVAIKTLSPEAGENEEAVKRFIREGKFVARLRHENITNVYDLGEAHGVRYLAMDFVEGRPLSDILDEEGALDPLRALDIARQVSDALAAAHAESIIHRDIKPANIMVDDNGFVKVMDFGVAKDLDEQSMLTQVGTTVGTRYYMSPEQITGPAVDHRTDIFSLGVVLFEMLTGRLPYSPNLAFLDLMNKIVEGPFPSPRIVDEHITDTVERIVQRMTATDREERYDSALDLSDDIRYCIRTKQYLEGAEEDTGSILKGPLKRILGSGDGAPKGHRADVPRRREDRERLGQLEVLSQEAEKRHKEGREAHRIIIRKNFRALLYTNCKAVADVESGSAAPTNARLLDIGNGGAAFFTRERLENDSRHVIVLHAADGTTFRSPGRIAWRHHFEKLDAYATGLEFVDVPPSDRDRLPNILIGFRKTAGF